MRGARHRPRISVVTVTNRPGSIDVTWDGLKRQTFQDFEWVLCDELHAWREEEVREHVNDPRLRHVPAPTRPGDLWNLNKAYNEALRHCCGELVVSLQDYIWVPPHGLARYWQVYQALGPRAFLSGVAELFAPTLPVTNPRGKVTIFSRPWSGRPVRRTRLDWRLLGSRGVIVEAGPGSWELNWAGAPLRAFYEIGGFPEEHDRLFYSCDNRSIAFCARRLGYRFYVDRVNGCYLIEHGGTFPKPADWEERHGQFGPWYQWFREWRASGCPRFPYLPAERPAGGTGLPAGRSAAGGPLGAPEAPATPGGPRRRPRRALR